MPVTARSERRELGWPSPVLLWSIVIGVPIALVSANVWPLLLRGLGAPIGSVAEGIFLLVFLWWQHRVSDRRARSQSMGVKSGRRDRIRRSRPRDDCPVIPSHAVSS
jgi:hypothetical protein